MAETGFITDVWLAYEPQSPDLDLAARYTDLLDESEKLRWKRFRFAGDRDRFLHARALVRTVLGGCLDMPPAQVKFSANAWGKPQLDQAFHASSKLQFNLSHTHGLAVLAVSEGAALGVDVEDTSRKVELPALAQRYFAADEVAALVLLPADELREQFFTLWTLKEAYLKALGLGLRIPLQDFSFSLDQAAVPCLHHPGEEFVNNHWQFDSLLLEGRFRLALAVRNQTGTKARIRLFQGMPGKDFVRIN